MHLFQYLRQHRRLQNDEVLMGLLVANISLMYKDEYGDSRWKRSPVIRQRDAKSEEDDVGVVERETLTTWWP